MSGSQALAGYALGTIYHVVQVACLLTQDPSCGGRRLELLDTALGKPCES